LNNIKKNKTSGEYEFNPKYKGDASLKQGDMSIINAIIAMIKSVNLTSSVVVVLRGIINLIMFMALIPLSVLSIWHFTRKFLVFISILTTANVATYSSFPVFN
jgi:hypothetical protein